MRSGRFSKDCGLLCGYARRQLGSDTDRDENACVWRWPDHNCSLSGGANEDCNPSSSVGWAASFRVGFINTDLPVRECGAHHQTTRRHITHVCALGGLFNLEKREF